MNWNLWFGQTIGFGWKHNDGTDRQKVENAWKIYFTFEWCYDSHRGDFTFFLEIGWSHKSFIVEVAFFKVFNCWKLKEVSKLSLINSITLIKRIC
jgi:hypothetical protein